MYFSQVEAAGVTGATTAAAAVAWLVYPPRRSVEREPSYGDTAGDAGTLAMDIMM